MGILYESFIVLGDEAIAPSHRISRLKAANTKPISVKPNDKVETAVTLMMRKRSDNYIPHRMTARAKAA